MRRSDEPVGTDPRELRSSVRVELDLASPTRPGRASRTAGRRTGASASTRQRQLRRSSVGRSSSRPAAGGSRLARGVQVVPGSPSMAASPEARGSGTATDEPVALSGWPVWSRVASAAPARGRAVSRASYDAATGMVTTRSKPFGSSDGDLPVLDAGGPLIDDHASRAVVAQRPQQDVVRAAPGLGNLGQHQRPAHVHARDRHLGQRQATPPSVASSTRSQDVGSPSSSTVFRSPGSSSTTWLVPESLTTLTLPRPVPASPRVTETASTPTGRARSRSATRPGGPPVAPETHWVSRRRRRRRRAARRGGHRRPCSSPTSTTRRTAGGADQPRRGLPALLVREQVVGRRVARSRTGRPGGHGRRAVVRRAEEALPLDAGRRSGPRARPASPVGPTSAARRVGCEPRTPASVRSSRSSGPPITTGSSSAVTAAPDRGSRPRRPR